MKNKEPDGIFVENVAKKLHPVNRVVFEEYQPEYVRMNIEPEVYKKPNNVQNNMKNTSNHQAQLTNSEIDNNELSKIPFSGQSSDNLWTNSLASAEDLDDPNKEEFFMEDVPEKSTDEEDQTNVENPNPDFDENDEFSFSSVKSDSYVLILDDQVVAVGDIKSLKDIILEMVSSEGVDVEKFSVLKKLSIKWGIFIDE